MSLRGCARTMAALSCAAPLADPQFQPSEPQDGGGFSSRKLVSMGSTSRGRSA